MMHYIHDHGHLTPLTFRHAIWWRRGHTDGWNDGGSHYSELPPKVDAGDSIDSEQPGGITSLLALFVKSP